MDWSKLDPNTVVVVASALISLGGFLWKKLHGEKTESFRSVMDDVLGNLMHELLDQYSGEDIDVYLDLARARIEAYAWTILAKRKVPRNALTEGLLHAATESATKWLAGQLVALKTIPEQLKTLTKSSSDVVSSMKEAEEKGRAESPMTGIVEVVKP